MPRIFRLQFSLRTLLVSMLILGIAPWIVIRYQNKRREDQVWSNVQKAKRLRNEAMLAWRSTYDRFVSGELTVRDEASARERYFSYRAQVETNIRELKAFYGNDDRQLRRAVDRRNTERAASEPVVSLAR